MNFIVSIHILIILYQSQSIMWPVVSILYVVYAFDSGCYSDGLSLTHLTDLAHWLVCVSVCYGHSGYVSVHLSVICIWLYFSLLSLLSGLQHTVCMTTFGLCDVLHSSADWPCVVCQTVCLLVCFSSSLSY